MAATQTSGANCSSEMLKCASLVIELATSLPLQPEKGPSAEDKVPRTAGKYSSGCARDVVASVVATSDNTTAQSDGCRVISTCRNRDECLAGVQLRSAQDLVASVGPPNRQRDRSK